MNTKKKIAIITGGCGLFGRLQIKALEEINYKVLVLDKDKKKIIKLKSNKEFKHVDFFSCDITQYEEILRIKDKIFKKYKNIHVLVNNAANDTVPKKKQKSRSTFYGLDIGDLKKDLNVGLIGAVYNSKVFGEQMVKNKYGIILNISSDLSIIAPDQRLYAHLGITKPVSYSITKHGLTGLTKYLAAYWAKKNVRVNAISPGPIFNGQPKKFVNKLRKLIPMERMCDKYELKSSIEFLCSDSSTYITGHNLIIDGGRTII